MARVDVAETREARPVFADQSWTETVRLVLARWRVAAEARIESKSCVLHGAVLADCEKRSLGRIRSWCWMLLQDFLARAAAVDALGMVVAESDGLR